jgi:hypothetical protein
VKSQGKSIQYHGQIPKEHGQELYEYFVDRIRSAVYEEAAQPLSNGPLPQSYRVWKEHRFQPKTVPQEWLQADASLPADRLFRNFRAAADGAATAGRYYGSFDASGLPLTDANGAPLSKSALKRLRKLYDAHERRHAKWKEQQERHGVNDHSAATTTDETSTTTPTDAASTTAVASIDWGDLLDGTVCPVVAGSFGKRQGLEFQSDMGPFCHLFHIP